METEWNKMLSGKIYDALDPLLLERLSATRAKIWEFNNIHPSETENLQVKLRDILGACGNRIHVNQPFRCDYGCNIYVGENFFANFNLTILDEAEVHIGDNVFIGPNVSIFTACHPVDAALRNTGVEWADPVSIGNNVWIGGDVTILPGVRIGNNVVIGAGAV
ncbi:MAG: sugar O-acetyltransferase, partial [Muribaculaceae bacterium]|nr:sugar O-acetyltransferase [Muribaculaceae bacterium]